ncbi:MAG: hypothetical protein AAGG11_07210 [Pseudomonadota bacterium]
MQHRQQGERCALCERETLLTFHHLIPKKAHRRPRFRKRYDRATLASGIRICRLCHRGIHKLYDEIELAERFNTLASLRADEALSRHISWVSRQQPGKRL